MIGTRVRATLVAATAQPATAASTRRRLPSRPRATGNPAWCDDARGRSCARVTGAVPARATSDEARCPIGRRGSAIGATGRTRRRCACARGANGTGRTGGAATGFDTAARSCTGTAAGALVTEETRTAFRDAAGGDACRTSVSPSPSGCTDVASAVGTTMGAACTVAGVAATDGDAAPAGAGADSVTGGAATAGLGAGEGSDAGAGTGGAGAPRGGRSVSGST
jgi:hypothetical protein